MRLSNNPTVREMSGGHHLFWCPGCSTHHVFIPTTVGGKGPRWTVEWSNPLTLSPSILVTGGADDRRCHMFIRNGHIEYLNDCTHDLKGQTVPMTDLKETIGD